MAESTERRSLRAPIHYSWLIADTLARIVLVLLYPAVLSGWAYWFLQLFLVPFTMMCIGGVTRDRLRVKLAQRFGYEDTAQLPTFVPAFTPGIVSTLCIMGMVWPIVWIGQLHPASGWSTAGLLLLILPAFVFYLISLSLFSLDLSGSLMWLEHGKDSPELARHEAMIFDTGDVADENDQVVTRLESGKALLDRRVDSYILESAFLGALAFSGFVSIMASGNSTAANLMEALAAIRAIVHSMVEHQAVKPEVWQELVKTEKLLALIALESLFSSLAFLSVIIARVRFTELMVPAEYYVSLAHRLNEKEDALSEAVSAEKEVPERVKLRLERLRNAIEATVGEGLLALQRLVPIVTYMGLFRAVGVLFFVCALATSALWFDQRLALAFAVTSATAFAYPWIDTLLRASETAQLTFSSIEGLLALAARRRRRVTPEHGQS